MCVHIFVNDMLLMISAVTPRLVVLYLFLIFYKIVFGLLLCLRTCLKCLQLQSEMVLCTVFLFFVNSLFDFVLCQMCPLLILYITFRCAVLCILVRKGWVINQVLGFCVCYVVPSTFSYHYMKVLHAGVFVIVIVSKTW